MEANRTKQIKWMACEWTQVGRCGALRARPKQSGYRTGITTADGRDSGTSTLNGEDDRIVEGQACISGGRIGTSLA